MATAIPALALCPAADVIEPSPQPDGFYPSLKAFFTAAFNEADELLAGLHRREVALLLSDEAQGKTHLLLQLALGLAAGQPVLPCSAKDRTPRRILYVNGDAAASRLCDELQAMMPDIADSTTAENNFYIMADMRLKGQPLNLHRESHWQWFGSQLQTAPADLVILDGLPEPLTLTGRSSTAARVQLLQKARQLAADNDCAVLVAVTAARRQRLTGTASAQAADSIYQLTSDQRRGEKYRQWHCWQSRWRLPEAVELQRQKSGRGYQLLQAKSAEEADEAAAKDCESFAEAVASVLSYLQEQAQASRADLRQAAEPSVAVTATAADAPPGFTRLRLDDLGTAPAPASLPRRQTKKSWRRR